MKVLMLNGSPHAAGCTNMALTLIAKQLQKNGVESEIVPLGTGAVYGCIACGKCVGKGRCIFDDVANVMIEKMAHADGLIIGSPVYYASPNGALVSVLDRMFYAGGASFAYKPAAAIASARRAGTTATLDMLNKYFTISRMPVVSSQYWNMVHGSQPEDVLADAEGVQIMHTLADNMAWLMRCIEAGKTAGIALPEKAAPIRTNFIR